MTSLLCVDFAITVEYIKTFGIIWLLLYCPWFEWAFTALRLTLRKASWEIYS